MRAHEKAKAVKPPDGVDVDEFSRRVSAALLEIGVYHEIHGQRIRFAPEDLPMIRQAQRLALESMHLPYEIVPESA